MHAEMKDSDKSNAIDVLKRFGIIKVVIGFDGSGDSGQIEGITVEKALHVFTDAELEGLTIPADCFNLDIHNGFTVDPDGEWVPCKEGKPAHLYQFIEEFANQLLNDDGTDWYNNDGGFGSITIMPGAQDQQIHLEMNQRVVEVHSNDTYWPREAGEGDDVTPGGNAGPEVSFAGAGGV